MSAIQSHHSRTISTAAVRDGDCAAVASVTLRYAGNKLADTVTYALDADAAAQYSFAKKALDTRTGKANVHSFLKWEVSSDAKSVAVSIKKKAQDWKAIEFDLVFVGINGTPNPPLFDPVVRNGGPHV